MPIGSLNERSLHAALKQWYRRPGDKSEVKVGGSIIDIVRGDLLIEIQTANFSSIRKKLRRLVGRHKLHLVYAIAEIKWIVKVAKSGTKVVSRRKSPKKGSLKELFQELVSVPELINEENFTLEVLMIEAEEIRCDDGKGSWSRRGASIRDKKLIEVRERHIFSSKGDFLSFLPESLQKPFSNKGLAHALGIHVYYAQQITYCLRRMGAIKVEGKKGNELLFDVAV